MRGVYSCLLLLNNLWNEALINSSFFPVFRTIIQIEAVLSLYSAVRVRHRLGIGNYIPIPMLGIYLFTEDMLATIGLGNLYDLSVQLPEELIKSLPGVPKEELRQSRLILHTFNPIKARIGLFYFHKGSKLTEIDLICGAVMNLLLSF